MRLQELAGCKEGVRATLGAAAVRGWELQALLGRGPGIRWQWESGAA